MIFKISLRVATCLLLASSLAHSDSEKLPFIDRDGQRFWNDGALSKYIHRQTRALAKDGKLTPGETILAQLRERTSLPAGTLPPPAPSLPILDAPTLATRLQQSTVVVMTLDDKNHDEYGTGFAIAPGIIVTNWHVVSPDQKFPHLVVMDHNGKVLPVTEGLASNIDNDLAILRIADPTGSIPHLPLAPTLPSPGETVWQTGHTHTSWWTFTEGTVNRYCLERYTPDGKEKSILLPVIDISNKVSAGSSGSAVVNNMGQVVGVYHARRWFYQTAGTWRIPAEPSKDGEKPKDPEEIKDRVVLFERNKCIPATRLLEMLAK
jgi:S1-C subfamily serine protease